MRQKDWWLELDRSWARKDFELSCARTMMTWHISRQTTLFRRAEPLKMHATQNRHVHELYVLMMGRKHIRARLWLLFG